jgi:hypothetical protein
MHLKLWNLVWPARIVAAAFVSLVIIGFSGPTAHDTTRKAVECRSDYANLGSCVKVT